MFGKIAILLPMFFLFLGLNKCKNPEEPEKPLGPLPIYEYRYNVEVIYTRGAGDYQKEQDRVLLHYYLYDPLRTEPPSYWTDLGTIGMNKIGENKYRCYLHKVFIQTPLLSLDKHRITVSDFIKNGGMKGESVDIQGAYEQEIVSRYVLYDAIKICAEFKMSKE